MKTGIFGKKGHLHYEAAPCIDAWLDTLPADMPKLEVFAAVAKHIDEEIHRRYRLYPGNWIALDEIEGTPKAHSDKYTEADVKVFEAYVAERLSKVRVPNPDMAFLRVPIVDDRFVVSSVLHDKEGTDRLFLSEEFPDAIQDDPCPFFQLFL